MKRYRDYHEYTEYNEEPGGLKRLDFVIDEIQKFTCLRHPVRARGTMPLRVLEIGCGNGNLCIPIGSLGYQITGIDIDERSIQKAKGKNRFSNVQLLNISAEQVEQKNHYDVVICSEVLEHLDEPQIMLQQMKKLAVPNALFLITVPNGESFLERIWRTWVWLKRYRIGKAMQNFKRTLFGTYDGTIQTANVETYHVQHFSLNSLHRLLERQNVRVVSVSNATWLFMELYILFLRIVIKRGSALFHLLDALDCRIADLLPHRMASGWYMTARNKRS